MARHMVETIKDDLTGEPGAEVRDFEFNGRKYQIDLTEASNINLEKALAALDDLLATHESRMKEANDAVAPFVEKATAEKQKGTRRARVTYGEGASRPARSGDTPDREHGRLVRQWGLDNGWEVSDRGALSAGLKDAYAEANPEQPTEVVEGTDSTITVGGAPQPQFQDGEPAYA